MLTSCRHRILPNGDLLLTAGNARRSCLADDLRERGSISAWYSLMVDDFSSNGHLHPVEPEDVGALTDAPIITDDMEYADDGARIVRGRVWWFPDYCIRDPMEELARKGRVIFQAAPAD
jgi:hypothetical protein